MPYKNAESVDATVYTEEYFLTECDGYTEYLGEKKDILTRRLRTLWKFLDIRQGMTLLDVGCGRGEILVYCGLHGIPAIGVDYSDNALRLARQAIVCIKSESQDRWLQPRLVLGNAKCLPWPDNSFDRVVMSDIVEHLYPHELESAFKEIYRVLAPGGQLLIHTMPNLWYYRYGYPLFRLIQGLRGISLPSNPRQRFKFSHVHVNEQTPLALHNALAKTGFASWRVWLYDYRTYETQVPMMRYFMHLLTHVPVMRFVFCDDIFACAHK